MCVILVLHLLIVFYPLALDLLDSWCDEWFSIKSITFYSSRKEGTSAASLLPSGAKKLGFPLILCGHQGSRAPRYCWALGVVLALQWASIGACLAPLLLVFCPRPLLTPWWMEARRGRALIVAGLWWPPSLSIRPPLLPPHWGEGGVPGLCQVGVRSKLPKCPLMTPLLMEVAFLLPSVHESCRSLLGHCDTVGEGELGNLIRGSRVWWLRLPTCTSLVCVVGAVVFVWCWAGGKQL